MQEVMIKSHLIITDIHNEYHMDWCGKIADAKPMLKDGLPIFVIIGIRGRIEFNTIDMKRIASAAKTLTYQKGKSAVSIDKARIYIKEEDGSDFLLGVMTHKNVKTFAPMFDKVGYA